VVPDLFDVVEDITVVEEAVRQHPVQPAKPPFCYLRVDAPANSDLSVTSVRERPVQPAKPPLCYLRVARLQPCETSSLGAVREHPVQPAVSGKLVSPYRLRQS
jgi:hypothetical protein